MLVLSRKAGERIHIGDQITLEVRRIAGNRVTLALRAPRTVRILRGELEKAATEFETTEFETEIAADETVELESAKPKLPVAVVSDTSSAAGCCVEVDL